MNGYLGTSLLSSLEGTPFQGYSPIQWAEYYLLSYGTTDGAHHKDWLIDQVLQILKGTPVIVSIAKWDNGTEEYRTELGEPSQAYLDCISDFEQDGEYEWVDGCAP